MPQAQFVQELAPAEEDASDYLRLMLNCLNFAGKGTKPLLQLKSVFELRILAYSGYMPDLECCSICGKPESDIMYFNTESGVITCADCSAFGEAVDAKILTALRYIIYCDFNKLFSFSLSESNLKRLSKISERFMIAQTQRSYTTLDFFNSLGV